MKGKSPMAETKSKSMAGIIIERETAVREYGRVFHSTFEVQLERYMTPLFGFDSVRFNDEVTRAKDGESVKGVVRRRYGEKAAKLIMKLIRM